MLSITNVVLDEESCGNPLLSDQQQQQEHPFPYLFCHQPWVAASLRAPIPLASTLAAVAEPADGTTATMSTLPMTLKKIAA